MVYAKFFYTRWFYAIVISIKVFLAVQQDRLGIKFPLVQQADIGIKFSLRTARKFLKFYAKVCMTEHDQVCAI